jgi:N-formylglutamate deformylase
MDHMLIRRPMSLRGLGMGNCPRQETRTVKPPASNFTILRPAPANAVPVVIHVPHAADYIPAHCRADFVLNEAELVGEIATMVDHFTDVIAESAVAKGAHVFQNNVCRLVVDPERYPNDADEMAAVWGMGAVYTHTQDGRRLRRENWNAMDRAGRMDEFYQPYHQAMRDLVRELRQRFRQPVHILDLHSFPDAPFPYETDTGPRPLYCVGFEEHFAPPMWLAWWQELAAKHTQAAVPDTGRDFVAFNRPFSGAFVPAGLADPEKDVRALMVEINRVMLPRYPERTHNMAASTDMQIVQGFLAHACGAFHR